MNHTFLAAMVLALIAGSAPADEARYRIDLNGNPTFTSNGARIASFAATRDTTGVLAARVTLNVPQTPAVSTVTVETGLRPELSQQPSLPGRGPGTSADADEAVTPVDGLPPSGPEWDAFKARAINTYLVQDAEEQLIGWRHYQRQKRLHPELDQDTLISNGIIDMIVSLDRPPLGDSRARPQEMTEVRPDRRTLKVRAGSGIVSRVTAGGKPAGVRYANDAPVTLTGKHSGPWYEVDATPRHWVCGLWLEFKQP